MSPSSCIRSFLCRRPAVLLALALLSAPAVFAHAKQSPASGIHKIRHVIIIMQENRSFDSYFGTFPGAEGFPMQNGEPAVCDPDDFLNGARLDPKTDGWPNPRPTVRETVPQLGDLVNDFDFSQRPRPPLILPENPKTDLIAPER